MFLGLCTKKELTRRVNSAKVKSYKNGYSDAVETIDYLYEEISFKDEQIQKLEKEKRKLQEIIEVEGHDKTIRIKAIARRTKKLRVKKKCKARLDEIALNEGGFRNDKK